MNRMGKTRHIFPDNCVVLRKGSATSLFKQNTTRYLELPHTYILSILSNCFHTICYDKKVLVVVGHLGRHAYMSQKQKEMQPSYLTTLKRNFFLDIMLEYARIPNNGQS